MKEFRIPTSLQRFAPNAPMNDDEVRKAARAAWHKHGTLVINPEWLTNPFDRQHTENIASKLFGPRKVEK